MPPGADRHGGTDGGGCGLRGPAGVRHALHGRHDGKRRPDGPPALPGGGPGQRGHPPGHQPRRPHPRGHDRHRRGGDHRRVGKRPDGGLSGFRLGRKGAHRQGDSHPGHHWKREIPGEVQCQAGQVNPWTL